MRPSRNKVSANDRRMINDLYSNQDTKGCRFVQKERSRSNLSVPARSRRPVQYDKLLALQQRWNADAWLRFQQSIDSPYHIAQRKIPRKAPVDLSPLTRTILTAKGD